MSRIKTTETFTEYDEEGNVVSDTTQYTYYPEKSDTMTRWEFGTPDPAEFGTFVPGMSAIIRGD